ncbi:GlcG/HbpS family heme-binding protein [Nocardia gipuzkoensis]|uniref:GlcG/HbpS family heme-binding protein n=1 Tax=Nocardia gipuzkoensis TaxID=2749991 RepID=UPI0015EE7F8E|nr:heme-binding protein [Nocardia gipuzkoensis]
MLLGDNAPMAISLDQADSVIAAARKAATELGASVCLAVVEAGGSLVASARMDGAPPHANEVAKRKADAAIALGFDTVHMTPAPQAQSLFGEPPRSGAHALVPNGGGVVIRVRGTVVGALGVSGAASSITDHKVGAAAVAQLS